MGAMYLTASHMNRRYDDFIRLYHGKKQAHPGNIRNGIHGSHLVEMDLLDSLTVDVGLCLGDQVVNRNNILFDLIRQI